MADSPDMSPERFASLSSNEKVAYLEEKASMGDVDSMYELGRLLKVTGESFAAREWFHKAANAGSNGAMLELGRSWRYGGGTEFSRSWLTALVKKGSGWDGMAMCELCALELASNNYEAALGWFERVSELKTRFAVEADLRAQLNYEAKLRRLPGVPPRRR